MSELLDYQGLQTYHGLISQEATPSTNGNGGSKGLMSASDKEKLDNIATGATANIGTVTGIKVGSSGSTINPSNGIVTIPEYPTEVEYKDVTYTVHVPSSNSSGALTLNFNDGPVQVHTVSSANISSVSTSNIPAGHSLHVIFRSDSTSATRTVAIAHNATTSCCPEGSALSLTVPEQGNGYTEVDFINVNNIIYVRGV